MTSWQADLGRIHRAVSDRGQTESPSWHETVGRARRVALGASLLDAAALSLDESRDAGIDELPIEVAAALKRVSPDFDLDVLAAYPEPALAGLASAVKGALFELEVERLVDEGTITLPAGAAEFHLVESFTTPAIDAQLLDADGELVDVVQLKASAAADIIERHLQLHPDTSSVWTTSEAAADADARGFEDVVDTGVSDAALEATIGSAFTDQVSTSFSDVLDEVVPQLTFLVIGLQAAWRMSRGEPADAVLGDVRRRAGAATALSVLAGLASSATATDAVRVPVVLMATSARIAYAEVEAARHRASNLVSILASLRRWA